MFYVDATLDPNKKTTGGTLNMLFTLNLNEYFPVEDQRNCVKMIKRPIRWYRFILLIIKLKTLDDLSFGGYTAA